MNIGCVNVLKKTIKPTIIAKIPVINFHITAAFPSFSSDIELIILDNPATIMAIEKINNRVKIAANEQIKIIIASKICNKPEIKFQALKLFSLNFLSIFSDHSIYLGDI